MKKHPEVHNSASSFISFTNTSSNNTGKKCTKCNINKPLDCFNNDKSKKDGKTSHCKDCKKMIMKF